MNQPPENLSEHFASVRKKIEKAIAHIKKRKPKDLDSQMAEIHADVFEQTDCLTCANCCKTTSPIFYMRDIERLAKHLHINPSLFIERFLQIDADQDYVLKTAPCPFLDADNYCSVYDSRPTACREYPHTDRKRFYQIADLSFQNAQICPAVCKILEELADKIL